MKKRGRDEENYKNKETKFDVNDEDKQEEELMFMITKITYSASDPPLTIEKYNDLEVKDKFIYGDALLFKKTTTGELYIHESRGIKIGLGKVTTIMKYLVYSTFHYTTTTDWKGGRKSTTYKVGEIEGHYLLSPDFYFPDDKRTVGDYIRNEYKYYIDNMTPTDEMIEHVPYFMFYDFEKYKDVLKLWNIKYKRGADFKKLLDKGRLIKEDIYNFVMTYNKHRLSNENIIKLFQINPLKWDLYEKKNFICLSLVLNYIYNALYTQNMFVNCISLDIDIRGGVKNGEKCDGQIVELCKKLTNDWKRLSEECITELNNVLSDCVKSIFHIEGNDVYLRSVWDAENSICDSISRIKRNLKSSEKIPHKFKPTKGDEQDEWIHRKLNNYKDPIHLLNGRAGTGKTHCIGKYVNTLLKNENYNILLTSFMGRTTGMLENRIVKEARSMKPKSHISAMNIDKFISLCEGIHVGKKEERKESEKKKKSIEEFSKSEKKGKESFKEYFLDLKEIIVDEFNTCALFLIENLLKYAKNTVIRITFVGDFAQFLSIDPGNMMGDFMEATKDENLKHLTTELKTLRRFDKDTSLCSNVMLVYDKSTEIESKFKTDQQTTIFNYKDIDTGPNDRGTSLMSRMIGLYSLYDSADIQVFSFRNKVCNQVSKSIQKDCVEHSDTKELPTFTTMKYFKPGDKIRFTKNYDKKKIQIRLIKKSSFTKITKQYSNLEQLYNKEKKKLLTSLHEIKSDCVRNGQLDVVKDVKFGFTTNKNDVPIAFFTVYYLTSSKHPVIVGSGGVKSKYVSSGLCATIYGMIGCEAKIGVWIISRYDTRMSCRDALVALSRGKERVYIFYQDSGIAFKKWFQGIVLKPPEKRNSKLSSKLVKVLKH